MKPIGFILKGYPRLSETFIAQEIRLLEERGFSIEIYSMRGPREQLRHPVHRQIKAPVVYIPEGKYWRLDVLARVAKTARAAPVAFVRAFIHALWFSLRRLTLSPLKRFVQAAWLCDRVGLGHRVSHLHAHFLHSPSELALYASRLAGISFSISAHAKDIYTSSPAEIAERLRASRFLVTCTEFNRQRLSELAGANGAKVKLAYHGVDTARFRPAPEPWKNRVFTVARLVDKKGHEDVLRALALLRGRGLEPAYDIYGEGGERARLERLASDLGLRTVSFHGAASQEEVLAACAAGGVFVLGSRRSTDGDQDGIPNSLAEAMSAALPVVATVISGIPELVADGCGLLVEERNPAALADAIEKILQDPVLARELGRAARERVNSIFRADQCVEKCAALLRPYAEAE